MTNTCPAFTFPSRIPAMHSNSFSKTIAGPEKDSPSLPVIFATEPSGAKLPYKILKCPVAFTGLVKGKITSCPSGNAFTASKFSLMVFPVTVKQSPCNNPCSKRYFITAGTPPIAKTSSIKYLPLGFKSANTGVLALTLVTSSKVKSILAVLAIANKCKTAFVEPPNTTTTVKAFSKAFLDNMSDGFMFFSNSTFKYSPAFKHSSFLSSLNAGFEELYGKLKPSASIADDIVFAVYIPPHAPAPGQAFFTTPLKSSSDIVPAYFSPNASKAETIFNVLSFIICLKQLCLHTP
jgi:hypothetical protein